MPVAYIYRGTFQVRSGETLRYREIAPDGVIAPEVTKTYAELAGIGSLSVPAVSLTPSVSAPTLSGVQIGAVAGASLSLRPVVSPAEVTGVQVGSIGAAAVLLQPAVAVGALTGVSAQAGTINAAAVSLQPTVSVGSLTGVVVASAPTQPVISATGGDTTVLIVLASGGTGATNYNIKWGTSTGTRTNTITGVTLPYTHTGRTNGTPYYYSLVANNASGSAESAEVSATPGVVNAVSLNFETSDIVDNTGTTWVKELFVNTEFGESGSITSGVTGGDTGNALAVIGGYYDDGADSYGPRPSYIVRTMNVAVGTISVRFKLMGPPLVVKIDGTTYSPGGTVGVWTTCTITVPSPLTNAVVKIGAIGNGTASLIDNVSIPQ